jgi:NADH:ubiquinone oxidoreductase subunit F (NADH-binding)/NADH:ubiquinone oxidoreductase subunit E
MEKAATGSLRRPEHPGSGRRQARVLPKGRQAGLEAREVIEELLGDNPRRRDLLIEYLHRIQDRHGQIPADLLAALAEEMRLSYAEVYEVATFYAHFNVVKEGEPGLPPLVIRVCDSLTCAMHGSAALHEALAGRAWPGARVVRAPCLGLCDQAPVAEVGHHFLHHATPAAVLEAVSQGDTQPHMADYVEFDRYRAAGGYQLLARLRAGELDVEAVMTGLEHAGLRGLGGAGFPTGRKWRAVRNQPGPRLMAVNGDEGEPGTFKDRHYLNTDPHRFLEGTLIAAHVVEAEEVFIYLRDEYPLARDILTREIGRLPPGGPVLNLRRGAGAYICGEESALLESLEGKRGLPRHKPPFPFQRGLFGRPTLINNIETLYWIRDILERGPDWWAGHGRHGSKGLRSYSVSGRVREPGVKLAPAGITLRELLEEHCGGMAEGHQLVAFLPGGASGGILPASMADLPLDFGTLEPHGCFIGSAAVIVLSQADDLRAAALNLMRFFEDESCGQCTPCRVGTQKARLLMEREEWDLPLLRDLSEVMRDASICGLGQAASNPLLSLLRHFPEIAGEERHPA